MVQLLMLVFVADYEMSSLDGFMFRRDHKGTDDKEMPIDVAEYFRAK